MKKTAVKKISAVVMTLIMIFTVSFSAFAETWQDSIEQQLKDFSDQFNSADPDSQVSIQESFDKFLEENGLEKIDLGSLSETDIGQIVTGIGDNLSIDSFLGLAGDAFSSGLAMIQDAIGKGTGTADGSGTATTKPAVTSPNIIVADPAPESSTVAVGVPEQNMPVTSTPTTYKVESTTAANLVGAGVTSSGTTAPQVSVEDTVSTSSMAVLIALSVSTVAVLVAIVIFFVLKKK